MYGAIIDASSNNIPTTFDETAGSLIASSLPAGVRIAFVNTTESVLAFSVADYSAAPSSVIGTNRNQGYIPAAPTGGTASIVLDGIVVSNGGRIYVRSDTGSAVTAGELRVMIWGV